MDATLIGYAASPKDLSNVPDPLKQANNLHPLFLENNVLGLVFDLDGTIIDSAADILHGMRLTLEQCGLGTLPDDYFPDDLHGTAEGILHSIIVEMGWPIPTDFTVLKAQYLLNYTTLDHQCTRLYDGALDVLHACRDASLPMGICTNKIHVSAVAATQKVGINGLFDFITGSDTWAEAKPSPVPLLETIRELGITPEQCLYFGDTSVDAACARDAGVRFVLHQSGYGDQALKGASSHFSFRHWDELLATNPSASLIL
ncbi:HAD-IA family hydrolase [Paenalcaligenes niemegkensis]|uniref:HAD family hydrolase n=1 Tax=Paenalcaligenes niemegkensis TaxID=2895469 RepID=UPI001EE7ED85|nr:HAD-IA family hydrolase [Paenalcaligenes niemegkensis]MCQ9618081.1 HAD-IA family hydrolase [Paenalcaligenes niemegkensis]